MQRGDNLQVEINEAAPLFIPYLITQSIPLNCLLDWDHLINKINSKEALPCYTSLPQAQIVAMDQHAKRSSIKFNSVIFECKPVAGSQRLEICKVYMLHLGLKDTSTVHYDHIFDSKHWYIFEFSHHGILKDQIYQHSLRYFLKKQSTLSNDAILNLLDADDYTTFIDSLNQEEKQNIQSHVRNALVAHFKWQKSSRKKYQTFLNLVTSYIEFIEHEIRLGKNEQFLNTFISLKRIISYPNYSPETKIAEIIQEANRQLAKQPSATAEKILLIISGYATNSARAQSDLQLSLNNAKLNSTFLPFLWQQPTSSPTLFYPSEKQASRRFCIGIKCENQAVGAAFYNQIQRLFSKVMTNKNMWPQIYLELGPYHERSSFLYKYQEELDVILVPALARADNAFSSKGLMHSLYPDCIFYSSEEEEDTLKQFSVQFTSPTALKPQNELTYNITLGLVDGQTKSGESILDDLITAIGKNNSEKLFCINLYFDATMDISDELLFKLSYFSNKKNLLIPFLQIEEIDAFILSREDFNTASDLGWAQKYSAGKVILHSSREGLFNAIPTQSCDTILSDILANLTDSDMIKIKQALQMYFYQNRPVFSYEPTPGFERGKKLHKLLMQASVNSNAKSQLFAYVDEIISGNDYYFNHKRSEKGLDTLLENYICPPRGNSL